MKNINQYTKQELIEMYSELRKLNTKILEANKKFSKKNNLLYKALIEFHWLVHFLEETMSYPEYPCNIKSLENNRELINNLLDKEG